MEGVTCGATSASLTVSGPGTDGLTVTVTGDPTRPPEGKGWQDDFRDTECVGSGCTICGNLALADTVACTWYYLDPVFQTGCFARSKVYYDWCNAAHQDKTDTWVAQARKYYRLIDVSSATKEDGVTLTLSGTNSGESYSQPVSLTGYLAGDARFVVSDTPTDFHPRDSRDPASDCANHPGDCYPQYSVRLEYQHHPIAALTPVEQTNRLGHRRIRIQEDSGDTEDQTTSRPDDLQQWTATFTFILEHANGQTTWLPGTSSNYAGGKRDSSGAVVKGSEDTASSPDYVFEKNSEKNLNSSLGTPTDDGLAISTVGSVLAVDGANVTVSSMDFGGAAILKVKCTINGQTFYAEADVPDGTSPRSYVRIPFDEDENGIADSWEALNLTSAHRGPNEDADELGPGSQSGDGFTNFDEYRGFHYVDDDWAESHPDVSKTKWTSTDPNTKDVFFWDASDTPDGKGPRVAGTGDASVPIFTKALRDLLEPRTAPMKYRRVNALQANAEAPEEPSQGVGVLNENSPTSDTSNSYAFEFQNSSLDNLIGFSPTFSNVGKPISIFNTKIEENIAISADVYRAAVLAHETGHMLGLCHYYDILVYQTPAPSSLLDLALSRFAAGTATTTTLGTTGWTVGWYNTYLSVVGNISQDVFDREHYDLAGNVLLVSGLDLPLGWVGNGALWPFMWSGLLDYAAFGTAQSGWTVPSSLVRNDWLQPITIRQSKIGVTRQHGFLMDRVLRIFQPQSTAGGSEQNNLHYLQNWNWRDGDLANMCGPACQADRRCLQ